MAAAVLCAAALLGAVARDALAKPLNVVSATLADR